MHGSSIEGETVVAVPWGRGPGVIHEHFGNIWRVCLGIFSAENGDFFSSIGHLTIVRRKVSMRVNLLEIFAAPERNYLTRSNL